MKETVAYCDLDDKDARRAGVAVLKFEVDGVTHVVDVCQVHLTLLSRLPTGATVRGRRRGVRRATKRATKRVASAPAAKATKAATKAAPARKRAAAKATKATKATKAPAKRATKVAAKRATKATRRGPVAGRVSGSRRDQQQQIAAARDWARAQGRTIADKGRLPAGLLEEFARASR